MSRYSVIFFGANNRDQNEILKGKIKENNHQYTDIKPKFNPSRGKIVDKSDANLLKFYLWFSATFLLHTTIILLEAFKSRKEIQDSDAIYVPHLADFSFFPAKIVSLLMNKPIIVASHTSIYFGVIENFGAFEKGSKTAKFFYHADRIIHHNSDKVLVLTRAYKEHFKDFYNVEEDKYEIVYVTAEEGKLERRKKVSKFNDTDVLYWGSFMPYHGLETVVEAAERLPEVQFTLVGTGVKRESIISKLENNNIENIDCPGYLKEEELMALIKGSSITLGAFAENMQNELNIGTKIAESSFLEKPIITSNSKGIKELFTHEEDIYLVEKENPIELSEGIEKLLENKKLRKRIGNGAKKTYQNNMSAEAHYEKFESILKEID